MKIERNISAILCVLLIFCSEVAFSQYSNEAGLDMSLSVPPVALVDIEPGLDNDIYFQVSPSMESGAEPVIENVSSQVLWLNYSSALKNKNRTRSVVAEIQGGKVPKGLKLYIQASNYVGNGSGVLGKPKNNKVELTTKPRAIVTKIGNCYTGDGIGNGHALTFSMELTNFSNITSVDETTFTILYTIRDN